MKTYWNHSEEERAALSSAEVDELLRYELMEAGVIIPPEPGPKPGLPECDLDYVVIYEVSKPGKYSGRDDLVSFATPEDAAKFCELNVVSCDYRHDIGYKHQFAVPVHDMQVAEKKVLSRDSLERHASMLAKHKEEVDDHDTKAKKYSDAKTAAAETCKTIWEDWHIRVEDAARVEMVKQTFDQYKSDCDGDETIALRFLQKAYDDELIQKSGLGVLEAMEA